MLMHHFCERMQFTNRLLCNLQGIFNFCQRLLHISSAKVCASETHFQLAIALVEFWPAGLQFDRYLARNIAKISSVQACPRAGLKLLVLGYAMNIWEVDFWKSHPQHVKLWKSNKKSSNVKTFKFFKLMQDIFRTLLFEILLYFIRGPHKIHQTKRGGLK